MYDSLTNLINLTITASSIQQCCFHGQKKLQEIFERHNPKHIQKTKSKNLNIIFFYLTFHQKKVLNYWTSAARWFFFTQIENRFWAERICLLLIETCQSEKVRFQLRLSHCFSLHRTGVRLRTAMTWRRGRSKPSSLMGRCWPRAARLPWSSPGTTRRPRGRRTSTASTCRLATRWVQSWGLLSCGHLYVLGTSVLWTPLLGHCVLGHQS